jgi:hypothetical protein
MLYNLNNETNEEADGINLAKDLQPSIFIITVTIREVRYEGLSKLTLKEDKLG